VKAAFDRFITAFNNLDWPTFRESFADDVTVFNPDIPEARNFHRVDGRRDVEASFAAVFAATRQATNGPPYLHISPKNVRIQEYGELAVLTFEFDRDGGSFGRRTLVFRHVGKKWLIVHIHASNIQPKG